MIIATPKIMYFALGMLALLLCGVHWTYGLPLVGYVAWKKSKLATPFISGFVLAALFMSPIIWAYVSMACEMWAFTIRSMFGG